MLDPTKDAAGNVIERAQSKYPFYKSKADGTIYPAMSNPAGYEDKNPEDWEPASDAEIAAERQKLAEIRAAKRAARAAETAADERDDAALAAKTAPPVVEAQETTTAAPPVVEALSTVTGADAPLAAQDPPPAVPTSGFKLPGKAN